MAGELDDVQAFVAVAQAGGFRGAARRTGDSVSRLSEALRRLEARLGTRLLHRTTRSVSLTEAGSRLLERAAPALAEVGAALDGARGEDGRPAGTLRLNVPVAASRLVLPVIVPPFLAAHPHIRMEIAAEDGLVDVLASGCDAGIRYEEHLAQDMIAVPIGPRTQRFAAAAAPAYLDRHGRPRHPRDLLRGHACLGGRFANGAVHRWEFERDGETLMVDPKGPLLIDVSTASDVAVAAALAGTGILYHFEDWLRPHLDTGDLEPVLPDWWPRFSGPFLYYSGRRLVPPPMRAFIEFARRFAWPV